NKVYLFGSIHAVKQDIYPLPNTIMNTFENCDALVVEADLTKINQNKIMELTQKNGIYPVGDSISNHISPENNKILEKKLKNLELDIELFKTSKPWFLATVIASAELLKIGYDPQNGIDMFFLDYADKLKKTIIELESAEYQIELLSGFSPEIQEMFLMDTIESYSDFETTLDTLVTTWQNGDEKGLEKIIIREMNKNPDLKPLYDKLFRERNIEMSLKIEEFLTTDKKFFIVVGSGHLIGEDGIIEILKEKGYTIRQL
ncbi:MAG TPA: TraB/GumN family protein, partial [Candidatus Cloacimonetes bacterium]|nr:TraB/GumN family protein [Candidatus Cloacimonadota bacterium]